MQRDYVPWYLQSDNVPFEHKYPSSAGGRKRTHGDLNNFRLPSMSRLRERPKDLALTRAERTEHNSSKWVRRVIHNA